MSKTRRPVRGEVERAAQGGPDPQEFRDDRDLATPGVRFDRTTHGDCSPEGRVTRSLLGYGVFAGPFYIAVSLAQALTRDGFDLSRHEWSLLANGPGGWIQMLNLALTGLMVVAAAVGFRRALREGRAAHWAPRLLAVYGAALVTAGIFRADPMNGFPVGTPGGPAGSPEPGRHASRRCGRRRLSRPGRGDLAARGALPARGTLREATPPG